jgi:hypothetical protein
MIIKQSQLILQYYSKYNNHSNNSHCISVYALIDIYDVGYMDIYFYCCFITLIFSF